MPLSHTVVKQQRFFGSSLQGNGSKMLHLFTTVVLSIFKVLEVSCQHVELATNSGCSTLGYVNYNLKAHGQQHGVHIFARPVATGSRTTGLVLSSPDPWQPNPQRSKEPTAS
jgi:hypothetical protein